MKYIPIDRVCQSKIHSRPDNNYLNRNKKINSLVSTQTLLIYYPMFVNTKITLKCYTTIIDSSIHSK